MSNRKVSIIAILGLLMLALGLSLSACNQATPEQTGLPPIEEPTKPLSQEPAAVEPVTLTVMHNMGPEAPAGPTFQALVEEFMAAYPNISIEQQLDTGDTVETRVETAFLAHEEPDVVMHNYLGPVRNWLEDGLIIPVDLYVAEWGLKDRLIPDAVAQYTTTDGHLAGIPMMGFNWPVWYNTAILEEAGVDTIPTTHAELIDAAQKIREAGYQPFVTGGSDWTGAQDFEFIVMGRLTPDQIWDLFANGGWSENPDAVAGVEDFVALRDAGVFVDNAEGLEFSSGNELFFSGKAAMIHSGSWCYGEIPEELVDDIVLGGFPLPTGSPYAVPYWWNAYLVKGIYITRNGAEKVDAIGEFVKFLYEPQNMAALLKAESFLPTIIDVPVSELDLAPLFVQSMSLYDELVFVPTADEVIPGDLWAALEGVSKSTYVPGTSAEEILEALDRIYEQ